MSKRKGAGVRVRARARPKVSPVSAPASALTDSRWLEQLLAAQTEIVDQVARGAELRVVLELLVHKLEHLCEGMWCSVLLLDAQGCLRHGAAPSLPRKYSSKVDGLRIGPAAGSCGTAAYRRERVIVQDTQTDPLWADYRELAQTYGLRACWSEPIIDTEGELLGTLAMYYREPRRPSMSELALIELAARVAAVTVHHARSEAALRESRERLALATDASRFGTWDWDLGSGRLHVNPRYVEIIGGTPDDFEPQIDSVRARIHPEDAERTVAAIAEHIKGHTPYYRVESRFRMADGRWRWVATYGQVTQRDAQGRALRLSGTNQDIHDLKTAQEDAHWLLTHIKLLMESTAEGICGVDAGGLCTFVNPAAARLLGYPAEELQGADLHSLVMHSHEDGRPSLRESTPLYKALRNDQRVHARDQVFWRRDRTAMPVEYSVSLIPGAGASAGAVLVFRDVTEARRLSQKLALQAVEDPLTGLLNRRGFEQRLAEVLEDTKATGTEHAFCYLDLDQFKLVNDSCGHAAGDQLLRQIESVFRPHIRHGDVLARLGGDEFGVLLMRCPVQHAERVAQKLCEATRGFRFSWGERKFSIGVSIGVVPIDGAATDVTALLTAADAACYVAKDAGRNRVHVSLANDEHVVRHRGQIQWAARIRDALDSDGFRLVFEPIRPLTAAGSKGTLRYEILTRMLNGDGGDVSPGQFIPAAERYQLMAEVDLWILRRLLRYLAERGIAPLRAANASLSVNLSGSSLTTPNLYAGISGAIREFGIPPECLCFEITETSAIANLAESVQLMKQLKNLGCQFALDDFGSGMSSFSYLKSLPVDYLKIDGSFIRPLRDDPVSGEIVAAINKVGHRMGLYTIAEHVSDEHLLDCVRELGVDYAQGYGIGRPQPLDGLSQALERVATPPNV